MRIGTSIITAASLSFLGLGAQPPTPEWVVMLSESRDYIGVIANTDLNRFNMPVTTVPLAYTISIEKVGGVLVVFPLTEDVKLL